MKTRNLLTVATGLVACMLVVWFSKSIQGSPKTYEVHPQINLPEYGIDAYSAIDAYERLMDRYIGLTERQLGKWGPNRRLRKKSHPNLPMRKPVRNVHHLRRKF